MSGNSFTYIIEFRDPERLAVAHSGTFSLHFSGLTVVSAALCLGEDAIGLAGFGMPAFAPRTEGGPNPFYGFPDNPNPGLAVLSFFLYGWSGRGRPGHGLWVELLLNLNLAGFVTQPILVGTGRLGEAGLEPRGYVVTAVTRPAKTGPAQPTT